MRWLDMLPALGKSRAVIPEHDLKVMASYPQMEQDNLRLDVPCMC